MILNNQLNNQLAQLSLRDNILSELTKYNYKDYKVEIIISNYSQRPLPSELYIDIYEQNQELNPFLTIEKTPIRLAQQYLAPGYECGIPVAIKCKQSIVVNHNKNKQIIIPICLYSLHNGRISNVISLNIKIKTSIQI